uniref:Imelysin-like domain-containing protein n=1 Tax=Ditylum brightwellii TaxID=49249 RepID=A0A7S1VY35_9STRA|mmetsp:Transcript_10970/g.16336  ORF Transcript_10970/g.16336 Transcript_10970/m.16336 type:complete len:218 (+) Transcript_10970:57-710(+)
MLALRFIWIVYFPIIGALQIGKCPDTICNRRTALATGGSTVCILISRPAFARTPGSKDVTEAIHQIQDAAHDLQKLQKAWSQYATIDAEGRAGSTDGARRILGGIAPQSGVAAIEVAKSTPLYRIDGAFTLIRNEALGASDESWTVALDLLTFDELADRILFAIQKADGDFYSVLFASKGTKQISGIFSEAKGQIDQAILDFEKMIVLLKDAGAPGL